MNTFKIKAGDSLPVLDVVLKGGDGEPQPLVGATVKVAVRKSGSVTALIDREGTIVDQAATDGDDLGRVQVTFSKTETRTTLGIGEFEVEFQVTLADPEKVGTFPTDPLPYIPMTVLRDWAA